MASASYKIDTGMKLIQISCNGIRTGGIHAKKIVIIFTNLITGQIIWKWHHYKTDNLLLQLIKHSSLRWWSAEVCLFEFLNETMYRDDTLHNSPTKPWGKRPGTYQTEGWVDPRVHQEDVRGNKISAAAGNWPPILWQQKFLKYNFLYFDWGANAAVQLGK
jgi:hypothetical protein